MVFTEGPSLWFLGGRVGEKGRFDSRNRPKHLAGGRLASGIRFLQLAYLYMFSFLHAHGINKD